MDIVRENKKGILIGFVCGMIVFPLIVILGLIFPLAEVLRPILIGPADFVAEFIQDTQTGPSSFYTPWYKTLAMFGVNGIVYSIIGGIISFILKSNRNINKQDSQPGRD